MILISLLWNRYFELPLFLYSHSVKHIGQLYFCWPWRSPALCSEAGSVWWTQLESRWTSICREAPRSRPAPTRRWKERGTLTKVFQTVFQYVVTRVMIVARETHSVVAVWLSLQSSCHEATLTERCETFHSRQKCWLVSIEWRQARLWLSQNGGICKKPLLSVDDAKARLSIFPPFFLTHLSLVGPTHSPCCWNTVPVGVRRA